MYTLPSLLLISHVWEEHWADAPLSCKNKYGPSNIPLSLLHLYFHRSLFLSEWSHTQYIKNNEANHIYSHKQIPNMYTCSRWLRFTEARVLVSSCLTRCLELEPQHSHVILIEVTADSTNHSAICWADNKRALLTLDHSQILFCGIFSYLLWRWQSKQQQMKQNAKQ